eukprot:gene7120-7873_t
MSADINNYFNKLERALRKLSIIVIDDFDEIKRGNPLPIVALMRKLLFSTSTVVMKQLLLRGCASHISDRKVVVSAFDLLRDTLRHSSPISVDQFFSMGFANHKLQLLTKLAEYVAQTDRHVVYSPNKVKFVVPNHVISQINERIVLGASSQDGGGDGSGSQRSSSAPPRGRYKPATATTPSSSSTPFLDDRVGDHFYATMSSEMDEGMAFPPSPPAPAPAASPLPANGAFSNRSLDMASLTTPPPPSPSRSLKSPANGNARGTTTTPRRTPSGSREDPPGPGGAVDRNSENPNKTFLSVEQVVEVDSLIERKVREAIQQVSERHEFIINKLVAAVDAEFTLLNNRIKVLENALQEKGLL